MNEYNFSIIKNYFGDKYIIDSNGIDIRYECPHCKELGKRINDYKLYVSSKTLVFHCFRCGWKGRLSKEDALSESYHNRVIDMIKSISSDTNYDEDDNDEDIYYRIPSKVLDKSDGKPYEYLIGRGLSDYDIHKYSIRLPSIDESPNLIGRVVIPNKVIGNNFTNMYVARTYINLEPKYKNPYSSPKDKVLFNYHNIPDNPERLIINEGVLTSIVAGYDSIATYGKSVSDYQIDMIVKLNPKRVYVSLDNDAKGEGMIDPTIDKIYKLIKSLLRKLPNSSIYWVKMPPGKDAVDLGRRKYRLEYIRNSILIPNEKFLELYTKISHIV